MESERNPNAVRPQSVADDDPAWDRVGDDEPCDWCGRPGRVEQFSWWTLKLEGRNPSLCAVCSFWFNLGGGPIDAIADDGADYGDVMRPFEEELKRRWREKVRNGERLPQQPTEQVTVTFSRVRIDSPEL